MYTNIRTPGKLMQFETTILDPNDWVWTHTRNPRVNQWVLRSKHNIDTATIMASVILTPVPDYRIIVRNRAGLTSMDDRATDLETAFLAAETYILFDRADIG